MNKKQKQALQHQLSEEQKVLKQLEGVYADALMAIDARVQALLARNDANTQTVIYQLQHQMALRKQVSGILDQLQGTQFDTVDDYLQACYDNGYTGAMYDIAGQVGAPVVMAPDPEQIVKAVKLDSKISTDLYTALGENVDQLKKKISATISRGISTGMTYAQIAQQLSSISNTGLYNATRIARTEGHRIQIQSALDAQHAAKDAGCDIVKQWDATLDGRTRPTHRQLDGQIREVDEPFETTNLKGVTIKADAPGLFGRASEDIHCRCALLQRAKWALDDEELEALKQRAAFFGLDKTQDFDDFKQKYLDAAQPAPVKPKKEILTKKKLEQKLSDGQNDLADLEAKLKAETGGYSWDDLVQTYGPDPLSKFKGKVSPETLQKVKDLHGQIDTLKADMSSWDDLLDKKNVSAKLKSLKKDQLLAQDALDQMDDVHEYVNIWKDPVTLKDYQAKQGAISAKKSYFQGKLSLATDPAEKAKWQGLLDDLDDFDAKGSAYLKALQDRDKAMAEWAKLKKAGTLKVDNSIGAAYTQDRKNAALWAKSPEEADKVLRAKAGEVWRGSTSQERYAAYDYTCGSGKFNRPLSGFEKPYAQSGTGWEPKWNKGVKNVWIDYEGAGDEIRQLTNMIERSTYDEDVWLQRGCGTNAMESFFGVSPGTLSSMSQKELQQYVGRSNRIYSFVSTATAKGKGFGGEVIMNIYAPKGSQMIYAEPFSHFGSGGKLNWDGKAAQSHFGYESEMLLQRGGSYTVTKIERSGRGTIYMDVELHPEAGYDLFQQDPNEWTGSKAKGR